MPHFILQKKQWLQFNESDDEGMMGLLEATTTPLCSPVEQPFVAEEDQIGSPDYVPGARGPRPPSRL